MGSYKKLTIAQLKEILVERNLSTTGLKNELLERIEKDDAQKEGSGAVVEEAVAEEPVVGAAAENAEPVGEAEGEAETEVKADAAVAEVATAEPVENEGPVVEQPKDEPEKLLSPEEIKVLALELLNKKLHRAKKFSQDQQDIESIEKLISRVERFGVDLHTSLARELGLVKEETKHPRKNNQPNNRRKNNNADNNRVNKSRKGGRNNRRRNFNESNRRRNNIPNY